MQLDQSHLIKYHMHRCLKYNFVLNCYSYSGETAYNKEGIIQGKLNHMHACTANSTIK